MKEMERPIGTKKTGWAHKGRDQVQPEVVSFLAGERTHRASRRGAQILLRQVDLHQIETRKHHPWIILESDHVQDGPVVRKE